MPDQTLDKSQIISGKKSISILLGEGTWASSGCLKFCWRPSERTMMMVAVPKRLFKRAVKRNLLKRRIRESFRTSKPDFAFTPAFEVLFSYNCPEVKTSAEIKKDMEAALTHISRKLNVPVAKDSKSNL